MELMKRFGSTKMKIPKKETDTTSRIKEIMKAHQSEQEKRKNQKLSEPINALVEFTKKRQLYEKRCFGQ